MRALWVLGLFALGGCATVERTPARSAPPLPDAGNQGGAWEVVLAGSAATEEAGAELARRDWALGYSEPCPSAVDWPEPDRPSLHDARRLYMPRRAHEVIYFRSWRDRRR